MQQKTRLGTVSNKNTGDLNVYATSTVLTFRSLKKMGSFSGDG